MTWNWTSIDGKINIACVVDIFNEGIDIEKIDCLLLLTKLDKSHKNYTITYHILVIAPIVIYALLIFLVVYIIFKMTR